MDQNITPINQPSKNVSWAKIIWSIVTVLLFVLQPLYLQYFPPQCVFFICGPSVYITAIIDFVWILSGLLIFVPQFKSGGVVKFKNGRIILFLVLSILLIRFAVPVLNYPYGLYKYFTRPQIFITAPSQGSTLEAGKEYELKWYTKYIPSDATLLISYGWSYDDANNNSGVYTVENFGMTANSGTYKFTFDPEKIKSRKYNLEISLSTYKGGNSIQVGIPSDVYSRLPIIVVNSNDKNIIARENDGWIKSSLLEFKKVANEELERARWKSVAALCKNNAINTEIGSLKIIADDLVKRKIGSYDQASAGIKCLSNETSFALSIEPNQIQKGVSSMCVNSYDVEVTTQGVAFTSQEGVKSGTPTFYKTPDQIVAVCR
ncbi:MAG: hypothetical protein HYT43_02270 [Candidatus Taylorbacteria bacterium]|nr:hypothetical protein [Candidatus Taylorbacteria bacterium]